MKRLSPLLILLCGLTMPAVARAADPAASPAPAAGAKTAAPAVMDSVGMLERAVARDSSKFDNLYRLGIMYLDRERMAEASRVFLKANQLRPKNVKVLVNLGVAFDASGHADEAQHYYRQALDVAPTDSVAMCRLASSEYAQGKYDAAITVLREVIQKNPRAHCAYFTMGVAFADAGIYRDAIRMWQKVIELSPDSPEAQSAKESIDVLEKFLQSK